MGEQEHAQKIKNIQLQAVDSKNAPFRSEVALSICQEKSTVDTGFDTTVNGTSGVTKIGPPPKITHKAHKTYAMK